jgi:hypothetical protein
MIDLMSLLSEHRVAFQLRADILGLCAGTPHDAPRYIRAPATLVVQEHPSSANPRSLITVEWNGEQWRVFAIDLLERSQLVTTATQ